MAKGGPGVGVGAPTGRNGPAVGGEETLRVLCAPVVSPFLRPFLRGESPPPPVVSPFLRRFFSGASPPPVATARSLPPSISASSEEVGGVAGGVESSSEEGSLIAFFCQHNKAP